MRGWLTIIVVFAVLSAMVSLLGSVFGKTGLLILIVAIVAYFGTIYYKKRELQKRKEQARLRTQLLRSEIIPQRMLAAMDIEMDFVQFGPRFALGVNRAARRFCVVGHDNAEVEFISAPKNILLVEKITLTQDEVQILTENNITDALNYTSKIIECALKVVTDDIAHPSIKLSFTDENEYNTTHRVLTNIAKANKY